MWTAFEWSRRRKPNATGPENKASRATRRCDLPIPGRTCPLDHSANGLLQGRPRSSTCLPGHFIAFEVARTIADLDGALDVGISAAMGIKSWPKSKRAHWRDSNIAKGIIGRTNFSHHSQVIDAGPPTRTLDESRPADPARRLSPCPPCT